METKRKRGRPKKVKLPEEIQTLVDEVKKESEIILEDPIEDSVTIPLQDKNWDVPINHPITFFDKRLSYELTGYIPINEESGLDFDPNKFTVARDTYLRTGKYTEYRMGSKLYHDFWTEEYKRCREGYTVDGYTVTGPNYYYLNYYQLPNIDVEIAGSGRTAIFPKFLVFQYEFFHYFELCRRLKKDVCLMKARGVGQD